MPDWPDLAARGFGEVLARHVTLAAPRRLIAFGDGVLSLLEHSLTHNGPDRSIFAHADHEVPLFRARSLDAFLARPAWKAELWNRMLDWMPPQGPGTTDKGTGA
jgi:DNA polymerase